MLVISNSYSYIMSMKCQITASELGSKLASAMEKEKKTKQKESKWKVGY